MVASREPIPLLGREEQARERRRQLVAIASALIEEGGADAVTLSRVTERAGCARTLIYRYFDSREELLIGVIHDYFERLDARVPEAELRAAMAAVLGAATDAGLAPARELVSLFWDVLVGAGLGGAILWTTPRASPRLRERIDASRSAYERRFTGPLREAGLSEAEARTVFDTMTASFVRLALRERAGELTREQAVDHQARVTLGLMGGLLEARQTPDTFLYR